MPIEGKVFVHDTEQVIELGLINPGQHVAMFSFPDGKEEVLSIGCNPSDLGGTVHKFDRSDINGVAEVAIPAALYTSENQVASIGPYGTHELELTHQSGLSATLRLRHFTRMAQTLMQSLN